MVGKGGCLHFVWSFRSLRGADSRRRSRGSDSPSFSTHILPCIPHRVKYQHRFRRSTIFRFVHTPLDLHTVCATIQVVVYPVAPRYCVGVGVTHMTKWSITLSPALLAGLVGRHPNTVLQDIHRGDLRAKMVDTEGTPVQKRQVGERIRFQIDPEEGLSYMARKHVPSHLVAQAREVLEARQARAEAVQQKRVEEEAARRARREAAQAQREAAIAANIRALRAQA